MRAPQVEERNADLGFVTNPSVIHLLRAAKLPRHEGQPEGVRRILVDSTIL